MTDVEILSMAIDSSGKSARQFAIDVLGVEDLTGRTMRRWLAGRELPGSVRIICAAIVLRPKLAEELEEAHARLVSGGRFAIAAPL